MVGIGSVLRFQYPTAVPPTDWRVENDTVHDTIVFWNTPVLGAQPAESTLATIQASTAYQTWLTPAAVDQRTRDTVATEFATGTTGVSQSDRAAAALVVDEINLLRQWIMGLKTGVAAATSLAELKTSVAALPTLPDRTLAQAKTAIQAKITAGSV